MFKVDFVVTDRETLAVDNNKGDDYSMRLANALSEDQILERQSVALAEMEEKRLKVQFIHICQGPWGSEAVWI